MRPLLRIVLLILVVGSGVGLRSARAATLPVPGACTVGNLPHGALSLFCIPTSGWNGNLVIWAHGYSAFNEPIAFQNLYVDDIYLPDLVQRLGFAFATTSYRQNGLAILEGVDDVRELLAAFPAIAGRAPGKTFMTGGSEGGIVTALLIERSPELFTGGLAGCGPIGDFQSQLDFVTDFRVLFDYFFPGIIPGEGPGILPEVIEHWDDTYVPQIKAALAARPGVTKELMRVSHAAYDWTNPATTMEQTTINLLWYNVFGANDAIAKLGGSPYGNKGRWYSGSSNDWRLNARVRRYEADPAALKAVKPYETTGKLTRPLVTLHTTGDEVIPYRHAPLYRAKVNAQRAGSKLTIVPIVRYGHCKFTATELVTTFALLVLKTTGKQIDVAPALAATQAQPQP